MGGVFGGDSSIKWEVVSDSPRNLESVDIPEGAKPRRHRQSGKEDTDLNRYFVVSIEVPRTPDDRDTLKRGLTAAAAAVDGVLPGGRVWFKLRIEDNQNGGANEDQIKIEWPTKGTTGDPSGDGGGVNPGGVIPGTNFTA